MTNTIPNVPRELLADLLGNDHDKRIMAERHLLAMLANAPSPAGVDGLEVVANNVPRHSVIPTDCSISPLVVDEADFLRVVSAAQAIIDGLRGEVAELINYGPGELIVRLYRHAQRIGELEGLLQMVRANGWYHPLEEHEIASIDAALSAGKDSAS